MLKHIVCNPLFRSKRGQYAFTLIASTILLLSVLAGCGSSIEDMKAVEYTPLPGDDWKVSTPEVQGLDPILVSKLYYNAAELETIYSLLVIKNGHLVAERYFNEGSVEQKDRLQSVTKSYTSALVGIALEQGYLSSIDQKMLDFFPEVADQITDSRKEQITIQHLLQMRAGISLGRNRSSSLGGTFIGSLSASYRRIPSHRRSRDRVPLQQSDVQLAGDYISPGGWYKSQVIRRGASFPADWCGGGRMGPRCGRSQQRLRGSPLFST